jgi:hypothetical protein
MRSQFVVAVAMGPALRAETSLLRNSDFIGADTRSYGTNQFSTSDLAINQCETAISKTDRRSRSVPYFRLSAVSIETERFTADVATHAGPLRVE